MKIYEAANEMSPQDWCDVLIRAAGAGDGEVPCYPLPSEEIQVITNNMSSVATMKAAAQGYKLLHGIIQDHFGDRRDLRLLDHGCGWGRFCRFYPQVIRPENITGVDVDERLIESCKAVLSPMMFHTTFSGEPLPLEDASADVIFSNSVFSHLSEDSQMFYIRELSRCLVPGGILVATTLNASHLNAYYRGEMHGWINKLVGDEDHGMATLERGDVLYGHTNRMVDYGITFMPDGWTRTHWAPMLNVVEVRRGVYTHDINIALKPKT